MEQLTFRSDGVEATEPQTVQRWDAIQQLPKSTRTPEGYLYAPATRVARAGVQEYKRADGTVQRELRLDDEVFSPDSLASLNGKPVVHRHPGKVNAKNARKYSRGVATSPRQDGEFIVADITIHDEDLIRAAERGDSEISLGYDTVLMPIQGGVFRQDGHPLDGTRADYLQTRIVHNHVALIDRGRANEGLSDRPVRLRLDSANNLVADEEVKLMKVTIGGVEFDVPDEAGKAINSLVAGHNSALAAVKKETEQAAARADAAAQKLDKETARADAAESKLNAIEAEKNDVAKQEMRAAEEAARFELMQEAKSVLKIDSADLARMSNSDIKKRIVQVRAPEVRFDGKGNEYVDAMYDAFRIARPNPAAQLAQAITRMERGKTTHNDSANESPLAKRHRELAEKRKGA